MVKIKIAFAPKALIMGPASECSITRSEHPREQDEKFPGESLQRAFNIVKNLFHNCRRDSVLRSDGDCRCE